MPDCGCITLERSEWHLKKQEWPRRAFYRSSHGLFFHIPIGIARAIQRAVEGIKAKGYTFSSPYMMLDDETGFFSADMLLAIDEIPAGDPNIVVWEPSTLYSRYYHGPFSGMAREVRALRDFVEDTDKRKPARIYTWVTNCPKCWKAQGGPTTVLFAKL